MSLDDMPIEATITPHTPLHIDPITGLEVTEVGALKGLLHSGDCVALLLGMD